MCSPDTVEDVAIWKDPDVQVGQDDVVEVAVLFVLEEKVGHPNHVGVSEGQVRNATCGGGIYRSFSTFGYHFLSF